MDERDPRPKSAQRLAGARVLVVGVGALGCPAARTLAAGGVGTLVLVDPDRVELSNLHRQPLYGSEAIGRCKVESAAETLRQEFPGLRVEAHARRLDAGNLPAFFAAADFVIDCTDGAVTKFLINDGAVRAGTPFSHAGVLGLIGQTMTVRPGVSACLRCLFPESPAEADTVSCRDAGIIGAVAGIVGTLQAGEALKHLTGVGEPLTDRLLTIDARTGRWRLVRLARNPRCPICAAPRAGRCLDAGGATR
jgi:molybdopterin/thiamine biosynthesis adenylyltransferase